ncbi:MAG: DNA recombination protein RmuC [Pseudomonadota bacterium]|nr:DNA recombination protein RmuC [Pseudomonadota bacterium]QKK05178.1 MAG: DNA recombination protein RmuC [Pseudomonadota bacterium]
MLTELMFFGCGAALGAAVLWLVFRKRLSGEEAAVLRTKLELAEEHHEKLAEEKQKFVEQMQEKMGDSFKAMSQEALNANRETFLALAKEKLKQSQDDALHDLDKRHKAIQELVKPVSDSLEKMDQKIGVLEKERQNAYGELKQYLSSMKLDQEKLRGETASLVQALRSPSQRGQWGELQLKRTLEMAGLVKGVHYEEQVTVKGEGLHQRPDVVVKMPGGQSIVIDAKVPLDAYLDSLKDGISEEERMRALDRHAAHVRARIKELSSKAYWEQFDTPEFVVMFLPGESYFSAALERDPSLLEAGIDHRVLPASPTTLISLLKAVSYGWRQEKLAQNAQEISMLGKDLYKRLAVFGGHMHKVGKGIAGAMSSYNQAVGSLERNVFSAARKFDALEVTTDQTQLPDLDPLDQSPRPLLSEDIKTTLPDAAPADDTEDDGAEEPPKKARKKA